MKASEGLGSDEVLTDQIGNTITLLYKKICCR